MNIGIFLMQGQRQVDLILRFNILVWRQASRTSNRTRTECLAANLLFVLWHYCDHFNESQMLKSYLRYVQNL